MGPQKKEVDMSQHSEASTQPNLSTEDRLLGVLYQFVKLHECWTKDWSGNQKALTDEINFLKKSIQNLSGVVSSCSQLEPAIQQQVQNIIRNAGAQIAQAVRQETNLLMTEAVYGQVNRLAQVVRDGESLIRHYQSQTRWQKWKVLGGSLVIALGVGVLVSWLLMPAPTLPLTQGDQIALIHGYIYDYVWPKLPAEDKADWNQIQKKMAGKG